ncbi:MAG TPA: non-heme iron oxygenase ferredoxin subunit [Phycisphaerales bacterium]|nr:non-heme iron oxygenase ferredoxin subunit [Phycisphaerales bacterium]
MSNKNLIKVGNQTDFPEGQAVAVEVDGFSVVICNFEGKLYAVENRCSHDDEELGSGELEGCSIVCPRHQAKFDVRDGTVTEPPAIYPIESFEVMVRGKSVYLDIDE